MSNYYMWNPWLASDAPPVVELFLSYGELAYIGDGTAVLIKGMLGDMGIRDRPVRWSLERYRAFYFTSYPGHDEEWRDRWPPVWRVRIELLRVPVAELPAGLGPIGTGAFDASWSPDRDPRRVAQARCLILADFPDELACAQAERSVGRAARMATITRGRALGRYPQLQIDLGERGGQFYEAGAGEAVAIMELCESVGGAVHFADSTGALPHAAAASRG